MQGTLGGTQRGSAAWHEQKEGGYGIFKKGQTKNRYAPLEGVPTDLDGQLSQFAVAPGFPAAIQQLKKLSKPRRETQRDMAQALHDKHPELSTNSWKAVLQKIKLGRAYSVAEQALKAAKLHVMKSHNKKCGV